MVKVVLDTNILVSALWSNKGNPYKILEHIFKNDLLLYYNYEILNEYIEVLYRNRFGFSEQDLQGLFSEIIIKGVLAESFIYDIRFIDENDKKFYDLAKSNEAILITGNIKHYPNEPFIMTPRKFLTFHNL